MTLEAWQTDRPQPRQQHDSVEDFSVRSKEFEQEGLAREEIFREAANRYANEVTRMRLAGLENSQPGARFGQALGAAFLRRFQINVLRGASPEELKTLRQDLINIAPSPREGKSMFAGILTEFGVFEAFKELSRDENFPELEKARIYHPLEEEDLVQGTDCFIQIEDTIYAIQIKAYAVSLNNLPVLHPVRVDEPLDHQLQGALLPYLTNLDTSEDHKLAILGDAQRKALSSVKRLTEGSQRYTNVVPVFMTVASPESLGSGINSQNGAPSEDFVRQLGEELRELHRSRQNYLSQPLARAA